jgi:hypothetical protein
MPAQPSARAARHCAAGLKGSQRWGRRRPARRPARPPEAAHSHSRRHRLSRSLRRRSYPTTDSRGRSLPVAVPTRRRRCQRPCGASAPVGPTSDRAPSPLHVCAALHVRALPPIQVRTSVHSRTVHCPGVASPLTPSFLPFRYPSPKASPWMLRSGNATRASAMNDQSPPSDVRDPAVRQLSDSVQAPRDDSPPWMV